MSTETFSDRYQFIDGVLKRKEDDVEMLKKINEIMNQEIPNVCACTCGEGPSGDQAGRIHCSDLFKQTSGGTQSACSNKICSECGGSITNIEQKKSKQPGCQGDQILNF